MEQHLVRKSTDDMLREEILGRLERDDHVNSRVAVQVENGVVRLDGTVPNNLVRAIALYDALEVDGVSRVINDLTVSGTSPSHAQ
jgi:osmotically-inducible protein OsmY